MAIANAGETSDLPSIEQTLLAVSTEPIAIFAESSQQMIGASAAFLREFTLPSVTGEKINKFLPPLNELADPFSFFGGGVVQATLCRISGTAYAVRGALGRSSSGDRIITVQYNRHLVTPANPSCSSPHLVRQQLSHGLPLSPGPTPERRNSEGNLAFIPDASSASLYLVGFEASRQEQGDDCNDTAPQSTPSDVHMPPDANITAEGGDQGLESQHDHIMLAGYALMMRTHLNGIMGMTQLISSTKLSHEQGLYMSMISTSATALLGTVTDVILMREVESGTLVDKPIDFSLAELMDESNESIAHDLKNMPFDIFAFLNPSCTWEVCGQPAILKLVLQKLAGFYSAHIPNLASIMLTVEQHDVTSAGFMAEFKLEAYDSKGRLSMIPPLKAASTDALHKWIGAQDKRSTPPLSTRFAPIFGVWLARKQVQRIGGTTHVSEDGVSLAFRVPFEWSAAPVQDKARDESTMLMPGSFLFQPSVLLVDTPSPLCQALVRCIEAGGFSVTVVDSLQKASERLGQEPFTALLINLPSRAAPADLSPDLVSVMDISEEIHSYDSPASTPPLDPAIAALSLESSSSSAAGTQLPVIEALLEMRRKQQNMEGLHVIVLSPFRQLRSFLKLGPVEQGLWQVLQKPINLRKLTTLLLEAICDAPRPAPARSKTSENEPLAEFAEHPPIPLSRKRLVLVVDDQKINQKLLVWMLKSMDIDAHIARDGVIAVKMFKRYDYDAILMDINMPNKNGFDAAQDIRAYEAMPTSCLLMWTRIPIIGMTAQHKHRPDFVNQYTEAGFDDFLTFPVERANLIEKLTKHIDRVRSAPRPAFSVNVVLDMGQGDRSAMVKVITLFVQMIAQQIGSFRNGLITDGVKDLFAGAEDLVAVSKKFHAVWLANAGNNFKAVLQGRTSNNADRLAAIAQLEEELLIIGNASDLMTKYLQIDETVFGLESDRFATVLATLAADSSREASSSKSKEQTENVWRKPSALNHDPAVDSAGNSSLCSPIMGASRPGPMP